MTIPYMKNKFMLRLMNLISVLLILCSCTTREHTQFVVENFSDFRLNQDSLYNYVSVALATWKTRPWAKDYSEDVFLNYVAPPQIAYEPIEYYWISDIPKWIGFNYQGESMLQFASKINSKIEVDTRPEDWGNSQMGYSVTMSGKFGKCDDRAILTAMAMRSMGIPAAFDIIPMCGSSNNGHSFCSVIASDNTSYVYQNSADDGMSICFEHKIPKIYRRRYFDNVAKSALRFNDNEYKPELFNDSRLIDVTAFHRIGQRSITIKPAEHTDKNECYLAVFHPNGWFPIAQGNLDNGYATFNNLGTGFDLDGNMTYKGDNVGEGIVYLPVLNDNTPIGYPFILSTDNVYELVPSVEKEPVTLRRKFPRSRRISMFAERMVGGIIEVANKEDFSDARQVYVIYDTPLCHVQKIALEGDMKIRYVRFRKPMGIISIAELAAYDFSGKKIGCSPIACSSLQTELSLENIQDNKPLTYLEVSRGINMWVGIDLGRPHMVSSIGFCPRNDDNDVSPGDVYELFYWDWGWKSLGEKKAETYELVYDDVPQNALLWLRNKSKGKEERPFTYKDTEQIWW